MNKIQTIGEIKTQRKRRTRALALPQLAASKIPHLKGSNSRSTLTQRQAAARKGFLTDPYKGKYILDTHEETAYILAMDAPKTLQEAIVYFSDPQRAFEYAVKLRWPNGKVSCPRCGSEKHSFIKTRRIWFCYPCQKQFTIKVGTIFEDSPLGMDKWMAAFWMLTNCKNGISSMEVHRALGITQKSAWFMLQRIRLALQDDFYGKKLGSRWRRD